MDLQNFLFHQKYSKKEKRLEAVSKKQERLLSILRQYANVNKSTPKSTNGEKFSKLKKLQSMYTFKITATKSKPHSSNEEYKHGWRRRSEIVLPQHIREKNEKRHKMIKLGNSYSMHNKLPSESQNQSSGAAQVKSSVEFKRDMWRRSRDLGNHFSSLYSRRHPSTPKTKVNVTDDEFERYERLMLKKNDAEKLYRSYIRYGRKPSDNFSLHYSRLIDEICRLEELLNLDYRICENGKVYDEILNLNSEITQKLMDELNCPSINRTEMSESVHINRCLGAIDIGKILHAASEIERRVERTLTEEMIDHQGDCKPSDGEKKKSEYFDQSVLKQVENEIFDGSLDLQSNNMKLVNPKLFVKNYLCNPPEAPTQQKTVDEDFAFKELEKVLVASVTQGQNENPQNECQKKMRGDENSPTSNIKMPHIPERDCRLPSSTSLHATSTFTSKRDIFSRTMEVRRKRLESNENNDDLKYSWSDEDPPSMEVVKHVINFDESE